MKKMSSIYQLGSHKKNHNRRHIPSQKGAGMSVVEGPLPSAIGNPNESEAAPRGKTVHVGVPDTLVEQCRSELDLIRVELIKNYARKPLRQFFQFDALLTRESVPGIEHNSSGTTDDDGDCINCQKNYDLRSTGDNTVRIQVPVGITPTETVRVLRKTADWIKSRPDLLADAQ